MATTLTADAHICDDLYEVLPLQNVEINIALRRILVDVLPRHATSVRSARRTTTMRRRPRTHIQTLVMPRTEIVEVVIRIRMTRRAWFCVLASVIGAVILAA